jgi:hypothetical protein
MSGQEFCQAIEAKKEKLRNNQKALAALRSFATGGLNRLWEEEEDKDNEVFKFIFNAFNKVKDTISVNYCSNLIGGKQSNIFIQNPSCFKAIQQICYNDKTKKYDEACLDKLYKAVDIYSNAPIEQINRNTQFAECNINSILGILTQQEQTLENLAIMSLIQEEQRKNTKSTSDSCSEISSDVTKEQYIRSFLECTNRNLISQRNIITSECHPNITSQVNVNNSIDRCIIESNLANRTKIRETQRVINSNPNLNNSSLPQPKNEDIKRESNLSQVTNPPVNNQENLIIIIGLSIGLIILIVFLLFIFRR